MPDPTAELPDDNPNTLLFHVVSRLARSMSRAAEDFAATEDLSLPELMVLLVLHEGIGFTGADLARRTFVTPQAGHQLATALVERGLVERTADPGDARTLLHGLTPQGVEVAARCREAIEDLDAAVLAGVDAPLRGQLVGGVLAAALTIRGGWFGDDDAEARSSERRSRKKRPSRR